MMFLENSYLREFNAKILSNKENQIILNQTIFYAKSGGQPGDRGILVVNGKSINIIDTIKDDKNNIIHISDQNENLINGDDVKGSINWKRRYKHMRMHSALHLLCSVIPFGVTGGQVGYDKSRLDFDIGNNKINKDEIEKKTNILVNEDHKIDYKWITTKELDKQPEIVRTMSVQPPRISGKIRLVKIGNIDLQPCGGTHVKSTKEIGKITLLKIENKGKKNRRVNIQLN